VLQLAGPGERASDPVNFSTGAAYSVARRRGSVWIPQAPAGVTSAGSAHAHHQVADSTSLESAPPRGLLGPSSSPPYQQLGPRPEGGRLLISRHREKKRGGCSGSYDRRAAMFFNPWHRRVAAREFLLKSGEKSRARGVIAHAAPCCRDSILIPVSSNPL
jgi:hypothetical protein